MYRLRKESYFNADAILSRQPLLYEQHFGNTMPSEPQEENKSLSSILMKQCERMEMKNLLEKQREKAEEAKSEHDSDDELEEEEQVGLDPSEDVGARLLSLIQEMEDRFLQGLDDFDYKQIDEDEELDGDWLEIRGRDEEEAYFDQGDATTGEGNEEGEHHVNDEPEEWETMTFEAKGEVDEFK